jgi:hypothetical protein
MTCALAIVALPAWVQFMDRCPECAMKSDLKEKQLFIAGWECATGLVGYFIGCGHERIAPFTRENSEAA